MEDRKFTLEELKQYDGKEGRPAYLAVDGVVYDATGSKMWRNGTHVRVHVAGGDLSGALLVAPHPKDRLNSLPRVGVVDAVVEKPAQQPLKDEVPWFARLSYAMHGHPASVHFPIALMVVASLLHIGAWFLTGTPLCGLTTASCGVDVNLCLNAALYCLVLGTVLAPVAIGTGMVDWWYQFGGKLTALFAWKLGLSALFMGLALAALAIRLALPEATVLFDLLVILLAPIALGLGFVGGRITFPTA